MKHWRAGDTVVLIIPKDELPSWLDTPGVLEIVEEHLEVGEELVRADIQGNDVLTLIVRIDTRREGDLSEAELDLKENGVPLV